jgi:flagellar hook-associated protein 1 FlgK
MSLSSLLSIARSALIAQQRAMAVTAQNVANAQTTGYARRRLMMQSAGLSSSNSILIGGGVLSGSVLRDDDPFLDAAYRRESSFLGNADAQLGFLQQIEVAVGEPSDTGVAAALDDLFQAYSDLAGNPASAIEREEVRQAAERFAAQLNRLSGSLAQQAGNVTEMMRTRVDEVNAITTRIANLNQKIAIGATGAGASPDLLDERDRLVDRLSELMSVKVETQENGSLTIRGGDTILVDGTGHQTLSVVSLGERGYGYQTETGVTLDPLDGSLEALSNLAATVLPGLQAQLDRFANAVVTEVNALHMTGYTADGRTGVAFFDPAGTTAATIGISADLEASLDAIAAGRSPEPGDNALALDLASLADQNLASLDNQTLGAFYGTFATVVGSDVESARLDVTAGEALVSQMESLRSSATGVSVDEEMVNLIAQQEAYAAAARLLEVAQGIIQDLLDAVG